MSDSLPLPAALLLGRYRLAFTAAEPLPLFGQATGILRGGVGLMLKRIACLQPNGALCQSRCAVRGPCVCGYLFEGAPPPDVPVLRGQTAIPPPLILSAAHPLPDLLEPGAPLVGELLLFGQAIWQLPSVLAALHALGWSGLGKARVRARLSEVTARLPDREVALWEPHQGRLMGNQPPPASAAAWSGGAPAVGHSLTLHFITPTQLKHQDQAIRTAPEFHVVVRTLLRRLSSLCAFHAGQRWEIDYAGWIERAAQIEIAEAAVTWQEKTRYSTRQQQVIGLHGLVGEVRYTGEVAPFLPLLRLGALIHVGKGIVFGNGRYTLEEATPPQPS